MKYFLMYVMATQVLRAIIKLALLASYEGYPRTTKWSRSDDAYAVERRNLSRDGITSVDNAVARIKRLNPSILLVNANKSMAEYCDLLLALQQLRLLLLLFWVVFS